MSNQTTRVDQDRKLLQEAQAKGAFASLKVYARLSGPGWLQSAITLGGGSLSSALYLGVLGGYSLLWLQGYSIMMGVIMLAAISYIVLSTGEKPFPAINRHINPVLGWGWAIATLLASFVWCLPQYSLACAVMQQNLLPGLVGADSILGSTVGKIAISLSLILISTAIVWRYNRQGRGARFFNTFLKALVGLIVICFFGVVFKLAFSSEGLPWAKIFSGFIPNLSQWSKPADSFTPFINKVAPQFKAFWSGKIVGMQQNIMIAAAGAAVGINMTFLLPYSILARKWDRYFRGAAIADLGIGMIVPFILVTSCIVIASASQFHTKPGTGLINEGGKPQGKLAFQYNRLCDGRLKAELGDAYTELSPEEKAIKCESLPKADRMMAAMLVKRDAFNLAESLGPLLGNTFAKIIFGIGVLGMALSTIIIEMLIAGFVICEMFGFTQGGREYRIAAIAAAVFGAFGPFIWSGKTLFWLAVPTSVIGMMLLPIAYITFMFMMNSKSLLKADMPMGKSRWIWNILMALSAFSATVAAGWSVWAKSKWVGAITVAIFVLLAVVVHLTRKKGEQQNSSGNSKPATA